MLYKKCCPSFELMKEMVLKFDEFAVVTDLHDSSIGYASETSTLLSCGGSLVSKSQNYVFHTIF